MYKLTLNGLKKLGYSSMHVPIIDEKGGHGFEKKRVYIREDLEDGKQRQDDVIIGILKLKNQKNICLKV